MARAFQWFLVAAFSIGCGSDDDSNGGGGSGGVGGAGGSTQCAEGEYALTGGIAGEAVSARGSLEGHAWIQAGSRNTLDAQFAGGGQLHTEWTRVIANGETIAVTGSITMPPGSARAGILLNAGSGMQKKLANEVGFELTELSESVTCVAPPCPPIAVEGSLSGCVHWRRISP